MRLMNRYNFPGKCHCPCLVVLWLCFAWAALAKLSASVTSPRIGESTLLADPPPLPLDGPEKLEVDPPDADAEHDAEYSSSPIPSCEPHTMQSSFVVLEGEKAEQILCSRCVVRWGLNCYRKI